MRYPKYIIREETVNDGYVEPEIVEAQDLQLADPYNCTIYVHNYGDSIMAMEDFNGLAAAQARCELLNAQFDLVVSVVRKRAFNQKDIDKLSELFDVPEYLAYESNEMRYK